LQELKTLFHIQNKKEEGLPLVLSLSIGERHAAFAITNKMSGDLHELAYCSTDNTDAAALDSLKEIFPVLKNVFFQVLVSYDTQQSQLISSAGFNPDNAADIITALYGYAPGRVVVAEQVTGWQLQNVYSLATDIQQWINIQFPAARFHQLYSNGVKNLVNNEAGTLLIDFRQEDFVVIAGKGSRFLLAQTYSYTTPEDVLYYLLKICQQFSLSQNEVAVQLSGFIDRQSSLYKELYQYFVNISFREPGWNNTGEHPAHFFTSLNDLATCAS
jgi:Protein of unknown function (DUF3822)